MDTHALLCERQKTHGDFKDHAFVTQHLKETMHRRNQWNTLTDSQREALDMIQHKIGRILAGNPSYKDHWDDIAGYATLVAEQCPK